eukprot:1146016-Pelagomonas_calceolata.AAC.1
MASLPCLPKGAVKQSNLLRAVKYQSSTKPHSTNVIREEVITEVITEEVITEEDIRGLETTARQENKPYVAFLRVIPSRCVNMSQ